MLRAALVDVGGTLLPETVILDHAARRARTTAVSEALATFPQADIEGLIDFLAGYPPRELRRSASSVIATALTDRRFPADADTVRRVRHAMCEDLSTVPPLPGAAALLAGIRALGLRSVIVSNTTFHDTHTYTAGFASLGWDRWIDGCVTSFDVGWGKPDRRLFTAAVTVAGAASDSCVMIGNREGADIVPALEMRMRAIRVAIEEPLPIRSAAHAITNSLSDALAILRSWL
jgi:FMN phosphatase YigB (HAD superfamily)